MKLSFVLLLLTNLAVAGNNVIPIEPVTDSENISCVMRYYGDTDFSGADGNGVVVEPRHENEERGTIAFETRSDFAFRRLPSPHSKYTKTVGHGEYTTTLRDGGSFSLAYIVNHVTAKASDGKPARGAQLGCLYGVINGPKGQMKAYVKQCGNEPASNFLMTGDSSVELDPFDPKSKWEPAAIGKDGQPVLNFNKTLYAETAGGEGVFKVECFTVAISSVPVK